MKGGTSGNSAGSTRARNRRANPRSDIAERQTPEPLRTWTNVLAEQRSAQAALDEAEALVRDARFDLDHTHIYAPFAGRMGTHLVSVGNLVSGKSWRRGLDDSSGNHCLGGSYLSELRYERGRLPHLPA